MTAREKLINTAISYVGYTEKASAENLDDFTANAGKNNYTSFARDYKNASGIDVQGQPWCDVFADMMFVYTFGAECAQKMLGGFSAYTPTSANYFKKMNRYYSKPAPGDVIFFKNSERIYHTGIVRAVDNKYVYTVEGNTSSANGIVENGGCVAMKSYSLNYDKIAGYGRPLYEAAEREDIMSKFKDIEGHYAEKHIEKLAEYGVVNGYEDGTFRPDEPVTRGQAAVMVANALRYLGK
ncbi:MAG: S-layer homology domain-containing protein [Oscillospiraceae bacterium]|nr:S-layer homology domain-containing protein [Oscillospiraceae bacterium]